VRITDAPALALLLVVPVACSTSRGTAAATATAAARPTGVELPPGEVAVLVLNARGTQDYECRPPKDGAGPNTWVFVRPEAELFDAGGQKVGTHGAGPTWESSVDGSKVVGAVKARADAPEPDAIPWLLLSSTETSPAGTFSGIRSILRTDTHGGTPPAGACERAGEQLKVPYTAVYSFSRSKP